MLRAAFGSVRASGRRRTAWQAVAGGASATAADITVDNAAQNHYFAGGIVGGRGFAHAHAVNIKNCSVGGSSGSRSRRRNCNVGEVTAVVRCLGETTRRFASKPSTRSARWAELIKRSGMQPTQIEELHTKFVSIAGEKGYMTAEDFWTIQPDGDSGVLDWLGGGTGFQHFAAFDRERNGRVTFEEFVLGLSSIVGASKRSERIHYSITRRQQGREVVLAWRESPRTIFLVIRRRDTDVLVAAARVGAWLQERGICVLVESAENQMAQFESVNEEVDGRRLKDVDFIVCIGGDGTLLHACSMFYHEDVVPPCVSFGMGSLGFLTPFQIEDFESMLNTVLKAHSGEGVVCSLRSRLRCEISHPPDDATGLPETTVHVVLNECLIDRGADRFLCQLRLFIDGHEATTVQADGLIISTPSGSTAYNLSAGGSMVAPSVGGILLTPVSPHTLSFRPVVVDAAAKIEVKLADAARAEARVIFDGRNEMVLRHDGIVRIETDMCPIPLVSMHPHDTEWFQSIRDKLYWNVRTNQKPYDG